MRQLIASFSAFEIVQDIQIHLRLDLRDKSVHKQTMTSLSDELSFSGRWFRLKKLSHIIGNVRKQFLMVGNLKILKRCNPLRKETFHSIF